MLNVKSEQPLVSIGLPVYSNPKLLLIAIESLIKQTYTNLEIIISDDCSPLEEIRQIIETFSKKDHRIKYYTQAKHIGAYLNCIYVLNKAKGAYFYWASEDDEWEENFINTGVQTLLNNLQYDAWCCTPVNIDSFGNTIRAYPGFARFTSTHDKKRDIIRYMCDPDIMGKANLFHSLYRRDSLIATLNNYCFTEDPGTDMCFNLSYLARYNIIGTNEVLFRKRIIRIDDNEAQPRSIIIRNPNKYTYSISKYFIYAKEYCKAVSNTPYRRLVFLIMVSKFPLILKNGIISTLKSILRKGFAIFGTE
jgi:glycosyltransferase involved in cell wall biosynthesis